MKPSPLTRDLLDVAPRVIWFEPPEQALSNPIRFLAYLMTYGTLDEIAVVQRYLDLDDFREALEHALPGIIDERSWAYWNTKVGRYPAPPMPRRIIPDATPR
jgi:hypothetical protein